MLLEVDHYTGFNEKKFQIRIPLLINSYFRAPLPNAPKRKKNAYNEPVQSVIPVKFFIDHCTLKQIVKYFSVQKKCFKIAM